MVVSKNVKICVIANANANICVNPNASQSNIGCVGSLGVGARIGNVHFMLFVSFHLRWVANANAVFSGIWALGGMSHLQQRIAKDDFIW